MPVTCVVPKAMFPLVDERNEIRSVLDVICQQTISAGIDSIGIIVSPRQTAMVQEYFKTVRDSNPDSLNFDIKWRCSYTSCRFCS